MSLANYVKQTDGGQFISDLRRGLEWMIENAPTRRTLYQIAGKIIGEPVNTIGTALPKAALTGRKSCRV